MLDSINMHDGKFNVENYVLGFIFVGGFAYALSNLSFLATWFLGYGLALVMGESAIESITSKLSNRVARIVMVGLVGVFGIVPMLVNMSFNQVFELVFSSIALFSFLVWLNIE